MRPTAAPATARPVTEWRRVGAGGWIRWPVVEHPEGWKTKAGTDLRAVRLGKRWIKGGPYVLSWNRWFLLTVELSDNGGLQIAGGFPASHRQTAGRPGGPSLPRLIGCHGFWWCGDCEKRCFAISGGPDLGASKTNYRTSRRSESRRGLLFVREEHQVPPWLLGAIR
jgi:hypothetical protein